jgi:hypothetical protein
MEKHFYVCSYGGCGSKMLCNALQPFGNVYHIHSRNPPDKLEYIGDMNNIKCYYEWFNGIQIPHDQIDNYYVLYIYKNPSKSIISRFTIPEHLDHIQCNRITLNDVVNSSKDLYGIHEFYNNYTQSNNRNYKIYAVKYEDIFDKQDELSALLGIGPLQLVKQETVYTDNNDIKLTEIYKDLIDTMNTNPFIMMN